MKNFIVEDRKAGEVVLEGKISAGGGVIVTNSKSLTETQVDGIVDHIKREVAAGNTRGRVGPGDLDWVEVVA